MPILTQCEMLKATGLGLVGTIADGVAVEEYQVRDGDVLATLCTALGVDPEEENISGIGRPISIADGTPIREILTCKLVA